MTSSVRDRKAKNPNNIPHSVYHSSFEEADARQKYDPEAAINSADYTENYMPDEVTRDFTKRMHYAAYRWRKAKGIAEAAKWQAAYVRLRDDVVLGNRKLVFRAVRRRMATSNRADDLIGDCQIVLIQAVAAFNPWLGIRFSTYAYTCLVRALARMSQKLSNDWLSKSASLDVLPEGEPGMKIDSELSSSGFFRIDEFLRADHPLLNYREKVIISRRFCAPEGADTLTLEQVGKELGLSKERVRQVQTSALNKLRGALIGVNS